MSEEQFEQEQDRKPALLQELSLGMLESLLNGFIDLDPETRSAVRERAGLVVRIKAADPDIVFFMHFTREGIELSGRSPSQARVRVSGSTLSLLSVLFGSHGLDTPGRIRVWGEEDHIAWLVDLMQQFNLRTSAQRWLREHVSLPDIWNKIRRHDPSWLSDLMPMPGMLRDALSEIRSLRRRLDEQQDAWLHQQALWETQRRWDIAVVVLTLLAVMAALLPGDTLRQRLAGLETEHLVIAALGLAVVATRFWRR